LSHAPTSQVPRIHDSCHTSRHGPPHLHIASDATDVQWVGETSRPTKYSISTIFGPTAKRRVGESRGQNVQWVGETQRGKTLPTRRSIQHLCI